jgi:receptor protein-tyrosine kinase
MSKALTNFSVVHPAGTPAIGSAPVPNTTPRPNRMPRIGEMLVEAGRMTQAQVDRVLEVQRSSTEGLRFGEIAIRLGFATKEQVSDVLARQYGSASELDLSMSRLPSKIVRAFQQVLPFAESIRALRSQLLLRWFDGTPGQSTLAITSVDRGDGKSFVTANLAVAFSQLGERTLVIDADMRHPTQHDIFGLKNPLGLSGVLSGRAGMDEIRAIDGLSNLSVLPAGPLPPNPQELLGRSEFARLLDELSSTFNVILIDTPSAQEASDAHVVSQRARAVLLVGRKDRTRAREIAQLSSIFTSSGISVLGATLNEY